MNYTEAGVDISLADQAKQRIRRLASRTITPRVNVREARRRMRCLA